jgi:hypothetical protein
MIGAAVLSVNAEIAVQWVTSPTWRNVTKNWVTHSNKCPGLHKKLLSAQPAEVEAFVMHVTQGGDKHRRNVCDAYATTYWVYKLKLAFTTGDKLCEV